jgi:hypothetical protein
MPPFLTLLHLKPKQTLRLEEEMTAFTATSEIGFRPAHS